MQLIQEMFADKYDQNAWDILRTLQLECAIDILKALEGPSQSKERGNAWVGKAQDCQSSKCMPSQPHARQRAFIGVKLGRSLNDGGPRCILRASSRSSDWRIPAKLLPFV